MTHIAESRRPSRNGWSTSWQPVLVDDQEILVDKQDILVDELEILVGEFEILVDKSLDKDW